MILKKLQTVLKTYTYGDKLLSVTAIAIFLLMLVKMILFPYGLFGFGSKDIYTEGLVARNGIQNINPLFVDYNEADREVSRLVFSGLMKYDPIKKAIVDDLGSLVISEDKTEYVFLIRDGIKWHDGKPLSVDDVFFTFNDVISDPAFPNEILKTNFAGVEIERVDDKRIKFKLQKPNSFFVANFTVGILPKHLLEGVAVDEILQNEFNKKPVGTGQYMVSEPVESFPDGRTQITLTRNDLYYGELPKIQFLRFLVYPTMDELVEEMDAVNGIVKISGSNVSTFKENERFKLIPYELPQYTAVFLNMESKLLKDQPKIRFALQKSLDKEILLGTFNDKISVDTPLLELDQEDLRYQTNIDEANGALKEAGFLYHTEDVNKEGIRYNTDEEALELNLIVRLYDGNSSQYEESKKIVQFLEQSWESVGFSIQLEFLDDQEFKQRIMSRKYDLLLVGQTLGYNLDTYSYWHSTQATPTGQNLSNYKSFQVDSLIEDVRNLFDQEKRSVKLKELASKIKEDIPAIFLFRPVYYYATDDKVSGISMDEMVFPSDRFSQIAKWEFK